MGDILSAKRKGELLELAARLAAHKEGLKDKIEKANAELSQVKYNYKTN